jgi:(p)ppGpp synthase/HD superfamily hydrolase
MASVYSPRYDRALAFAATAHRDQLRKGTSIPYIAHVVHVSVILIRHGFDEDLAVAGLLHDVVEDCDIPIDEIRAQFGERVAQLVEAVSEQKADDGGPLPWEVRKATKLAHLRSGGPDVAALKAADAIHNARSISADLQTDGQAIWSRFKRGPEPTLGYYRDILDGVRHWLAPHPITAELADTVAELASTIDSV